MKDPSQISQYRIQIEEPSHVRSDAVIRSISRPAAPGLGKLRSDGLMVYLNDEPLPTLNLCKPYF